MKKLAYFAPNLNTVAAFFKTSERTIRNWTQVDGFPLKTKAGYNLSEIAAWRIDYLNKLANQGAGSASNDRLKDLRSEKLELELAVERGKVLGADAVARVWRRYFTAARTVILGIPESVVILMPPELRSSVRPQVQAKIDEVLASLERIPGEWEK